MCRQVPTLMRWEVKWRCPTRLPITPVHAAITIDAWLACRAVDAPDFVLAPESSHALAQLPSPAVVFDMMVGPEGGWTEDEVARAVRAGGAAVRLGPRVLRTETAAAAALAAINRLLTSR